MLYKFVLIFTFEVKYCEYCDMFIWISSSQTLLIKTFNTQDYYKLYVTYFYSKKHLNMEQERKKET